MTAVPSSFHVYNEDNPLPTGGSSDWLFRRLFKAISRLVYSSTGDLRVVLGIGTGSTLATGYIALGDSTKSGTNMMVSRQITGTSTRRNLIRT